MKIAAFFSDSPFASWGQSRGLATVLRRMGHEVVDIPIPPTKQITRSQIERINKPIDDCELILVSGPEHLRDWINQFYPQWEKLKAPKVGWYHESFHAREDYTLNFENFRGMFDYHVFPDADDAAKYGGTQLSLGVDTELFNHGVSIRKPKNVGGHSWCGCGVELTREPHFCPYLDTMREIDTAFIGLMYPKRQRFYEELKPFLKGINLRVGTVVVQSLDGVDTQRTAELLAEIYRSIKVFVAFPSICNVLVAKILESMASGCYLIATEQPGIKHYAKYSTPKECAREIREALEANVYREKIARQGCEEVHKDHRMELRFERIFELVGLAVKSEVAQ